MRLEPSARAKATRRFVSRFTADIPTTEVASRVDASVIAGIRGIRDEIRQAEGGGGMCHVVTEDLNVTRGWGRLAVSYLSPSGDVICCAHYVSVLADGTIVDPTADQFGEGHDVRVLTVDDTDYGRYRPEFDREWNPKTEPSLIGDWAPDWGGVSDMEAQNELAEERGIDWAVTDRPARRAYLNSQLAYARAKNDGYAPWLEARLTDIDAAIAGELVAFAP